MVIIYEFIFSIGNSVKLISETIIFSLLILITVIDIEHHLVLNMISLAGVIIFGIIGIIFSWMVSHLLWRINGIWCHVCSFYLGKLYSQYISRKRGIEVEDGIGFGDVTLSAVCGLLLGWPGVIGGLFLSIILGGVWSLGMILAAMIRKTGEPVIKIYCLRSIYYNSYRSSLVDAKIRFLRIKVEV